jgi:DNA-binding response OmpR family regulator
MAETVEENPKPFSFLGGQVVIDSVQGILLVDDKLRYTSPHQQAMLNLLARNAGEVVTRPQIQMALYGNTNGRAKSIDQNVLECRKKLNPYGLLIVTARALSGMTNGGYMIQDRASASE